jgi:hypothetical protein
VASDSTVVSPSTSGDQLFSPITIYSPRIEDQKAVPLDLPMSSEEAADPFRHVFDAPMASRIVQALGPDDLPQAQLADILGRIGTTLKRHQQSGSWGTIVRLGNVGVEPVPTVVFGFQEPTGIDIGGGWPLDLVVTHEPFSDGVAIPVTWINSACVERDVVSIAEVSLGVATLTTGASSFGGYVRTALGDKFGVSAAHVTPEPIGSEVSCPSTVELTARLRNILPYTSLNPRPSRFHRFRDEPDAEAKHMLSTYRISDDPDDGIELVGHQGKKILSGNRLGQIVAKELRYADGIFAKHNLYLSQAGLRPFVLPTGQEHITHSKIDWVMFTVEDSRLAELSFSASFRVGADKITWVSDSAETFTTQEMKNL